MSNALDRQARREQVDRNRDTCFLREQAKDFKILSWTVRQRLGGVSIGACQTFSFMKISLLLDENWPAGSENRGSHWADGPEATEARPVPSSAASLCTDISMVLSDGWLLPYVLLIMWPEETNFRSFSKTSGDWWVLCLLPISFSPNIRTLGTLALGSGDREEACFSGQGAS